MFKLLKTIAPFGFVAVFVAGIFAVGIGNFGKSQQEENEIRRKAALSFSARLSEISASLDATPQQTTTAPEPPPPTAPSIPLIPAKDASAPPDNIAPDRVYFLMQRISGETATGIVGFPTGTPVKYVSNNGELFHVSSGNSEFEVQRNQLTADLNIARQVAAADSKTQALIAGIGNTWRLIDEENERKKIADFKQQQNEVFHPRAAQTQAAFSDATQTPAGNRLDNPLERGAYNSKSTSGGMIHYGPLGQLKQMIDNGNLNEARDFLRQYVLPARYTRSGFGEQDLAALSIAIEREQESPTGRKFQQNEVLQPRTAVTPNTSSDLAHDRQQLELIRTRVERERQETIDEDKRRISELEMEYLKLSDKRYFDKPWRDRLIQQQIEARQKLERDSRR